MRARRDLRMEIRSFPRRRSPRRDGRTAVIHRHHQRPRSSPRLSSALPALQRRNGRLISSRPSIRRAEQVARRGGIFRTARAASDLIRSCTLNCRIREGLVGAAVGLALALAGCDYSRPASETLSPGGTYKPGTVKLQGARSTPKPAGKVVRDTEEKAAILKSSIELIQRAAL